MSDPAPELAVAAKRIAALEADVANLRRGMVQQLTATGKLIQHALALDAHFGGRFLAERQPNPQEEVAIAVEILTAASAELGGKGQVNAAPTEANPAVSELLRSELVARDMELADVRRQTAVLQEEYGQTLGDLRERLAEAEERAASAEHRTSALRDATDGSDDDRRSDRAEASGLCSELLRLMQAQPVGDDEAQITIQVLADALREGAPLGTLCQAAESAMVNWGQLMFKELANARAQLGGIEALRTTAGEWQQQAAQLRSELERARTEAAKYQSEAASTSERSGIIEREITKLQTERETLVRDVERLQIELGEQRRATSEANTARSRERHETESIRALEKNQVEQTVAGAQAEAAAAKLDAQQAIADREHAVGRLTNLQERIDRLEAERQRMTEALTTTQAELEATKAEREQAQRDQDDRRGE
ncbi:MAG: hypothetical protein AAB263_10430 [Planctomycetota bacterium]